MNSKAFKSLYLTVSIAIFCCFSYSATAVVLVKAPAVDTLRAMNQAVSMVPSEAVKESTTAKKGWRSNKKIKRVKRFIKRALKKNNSFGNVLASRKFRLGALFLLVGILGALAVNLFTLAQIFGWIAGVLALTGLILMIWSLIEHSGIL